MRRPSARAFPATFTPATLAGWTIDASGGRVPTPAATGTPLPCQPAPASTTSVPAGLREEGLVYLTLCFPDDPGLRLRDEGTLSGRAGILTVIGVRDQAGRMALFEVDCELRS